MAHTSSVPQSVRPFSARTRFSFSLRPVGLENGSGAHSKMVTNTVAFSSPLTACTVPPAR